jgi:hypothetical protein
LRGRAAGDGIAVERSNRGADDEVGLHAIGKGSPGACLPGSEESAAGEYERTFHDGFIFAYVERVGWCPVGRAWPCPTQLQ